jgi:hypothetical protein
MRINRHVLEEGVPSRTPSECADCRVGVTVSLRTIEPASRADLLSGEQAFLPSHIPKFERMTADKCTMVGLHLVPQLFIADSQGHGSTLVSVINKKVPEVILPQI